MTGSIPSTHILPLATYYTWFITLLSVYASIRESTLFFYGNAVLIWRKKNKNKEGEEEWGSEGKKEKVVLSPLGKLESQMQWLNGATRRQGISLALVDFLTFLSQRIFIKESQREWSSIRKKDTIMEIYLMDSLIASSLQYFC